VAETRWIDLLDLSKEDLEKATPREPSAAPI
jgi:hypothetical protein